MKSIFSFILMASIFSNFAKADESPISFRVKVDQSILIPASAQTCKEEANSLQTTSVPGKYFNFYFPQIEIDKNKISHDASVRIISLRMSINSQHIENGNYSCQLSGDDLSYLFYSRNSKTPWNHNNITYDPTAVASDGTLGDFRASHYYVNNKNYNSCPIKCGNIRTDDVSFDAPVIFEMLAVTSTKRGDGSLEQIPLKIISKGTIKNLF